MRLKFLRRGTRRYIKLGRSRKKKQKWRKPKGRDNKMRERKKGRAKSVEIGYKKRKERDKKEWRVENLEQAERVEKGMLIIIGRVGKKKKEELIKKIEERGGKILNKPKQRKKK